MRFLVAAVLLLSMQAKASWIVDEGTVVCDEKSRSGKIGGGLKGGSNPWPWGQETSFPWLGIEGVWQVSNSSCSNLFMFKVGGVMGTGERYIRITQYDPVQCKVLATGVGYEGSRVVKAVLTGQRGSFEMTIHAFKDSDLKTSVGGGTVVVMRLRPIGSATVPNGYQLDRLQKSVRMVCE